MGWVDGPLHAEAVRQLSPVDQLSFLIMRKRGEQRAFAFVRDFVGRGFQLLE